MVWQAKNFYLPLEFQPRLLAIGRSQHTAGPIDRYKISGYSRQLWLTGRTNVPFGNWKMTRKSGLWCFHLYTYPGGLSINGEKFPIRPNFAGIIPPGAVLEYEYDSPVAIHLVAHFALPYSTKSLSAIPAMQDLGGDFSGAYAAMEGAVGCYPSNPLRAEIRLWDLLWQMATRAKGAAVAADQTHPVVQRAIQTIELRLGESLAVAGLARELEISHNHLTRLFHKETGQTVIGYIRARRVQRAVHLITHSTQPIKAIAVEVGIPDLHLFNKTVRGSLGVSPRGLRGKARGRMR